MSDVGMGLEGLGLALLVGAAAAMLVVWTLLARAVQRRTTRSGSPFVYLAAWSFFAGSVTLYLDDLVREHVGRRYVGVGVALALGAALAIVVARQRRTFDTARAATRD